jgi:hypothetical protein
VLETFLLALEEREASGMVITVTVTMMSSQRPTLGRRLEQPGLQPLSRSFPRLDPDDSSPHEIAEALEVAFCRCQERSCDDKRADAVAAMPLLLFFKDDDCSKNTEYDRPCQKPAEPGAAEICDS